MGEIKHAILLLKVNIILIYFNIIYYLILIFNIIGSDISNHLQAEQIHRWKKEYPDWRMPEDKMSKKKIKGKGMPNFCGPNESKSCLESELNEKLTFISI